MSAALATAIEDALAAALQAQPWWRRWSNTICAFASAMVTLGTWATATWTGMPQTAATVLGAVVMVAGVLAQRATRNGLTPRGNADVATALRGVAPRSAAPRYTAGDLMAMRAQRFADDVAGTVVDRARAAGWSEHDPRYLGLAAGDAAQASLVAEPGGRHRRPE